MVAWSSIASPIVVVPRVSLSSSIVAIPRVSIAPSVVVPPRVTTASPGILKPPVILIPAVPVAPPTVVVSRVPIVARVVAGPPLPLRTSSPIPARVIVTLSACLGILLRTQAQERVPPLLGGGLREVHLDAAVVHEVVVRLQIGLHGLVLLLKLDEAEVQAVPGHMILADVRLARTEAAEDELQILLRGHGIQLRDEQDVLRRFVVGVLEVSQHLQHHRSRLRLLPRSLQLHLFRVSIGVGVQLLVGAQALDQLLFGGSLASRRRRRNLLPQRFRVWERIVQDVRVEDSDVSIRPPVLVAELRGDLLHGLHPFRDFSEDRLLSIEMLEVVTAQRDEELRRVGVLRSSSGHAEQSGAIVLQMSSYLIVEVSLSLPLFLVILEKRKRGLSAVSRARGVSSLDEIVLLNVEK
mmetsp:Transcript_4570/g.17999  ORF Transcript_4570/g.17999 Transcript_4570/m.17999 type:complete len:409 (+) Transcript_4570:584-1810(+)